MYVREGNVPVGSVGNDALDRLSRIGVTGRVGASTGQFRESLWYHNSRDEGAEEEKTT